MSTPHKAEKDRSGSPLGFPASRASHLVGIGDYTTPWVKEWSAAIAAGVESGVLFAIDQFCISGYAMPRDPVRWAIRG